MPTPVQCIPVLEPIAPGLPYGNDVFLDDVLAQMAAAGTDEPLPVADFTVASKIALTGGLYALASSATDAANGPLTYAWSGPPAVTFGAPTADYTAFTATAPGQYDIGLTVTDAAGHTAQQEQRIVVDRVLYVGGTEQSAFTALQNAFDWINANDAANAASYVIKVTGTTADAVRIVPNLARLELASTAVIPVGVDFPAGSFAWPAMGRGHARIVSTNGPAITLTTGTTVSMTGMRLECNDGAASVVTLAGGSTLSLGFASITGAAANGITGLGNVVAYSTGIGLALALTNGSSVTALACTFSGAKDSIAGGAILVVLAGCLWTMTSGAAAINLTDPRGQMVGCRFNSAGTSAMQNAAIVQLATPAAGQRFMMAGNMVQGTQNGAVTNSGIKILPGGTGALHINNNMVYVNGKAVHFVGTPTGTLILGSNTLEGGQHSVLSTTDEAGAVPLALANAPFYGNVFKGVIANVTFAVGTALNGGNVQV